MNVAIVAAQETGIDGVVAGILASLVALLAGKLVAWLKERAGIKVAADEKVARDSLEVGVHEAWEQEGKQLKQAVTERAEKARDEKNEGKKRGDDDWDYFAGDGAKLAETDKLRLRQIAIAAAERVAASRGVNLRKALGAGTILGALIRKIVDRRKRDA